MNDYFDRIRIEELEKRVESLENMLSSLIGFVEDRLQVDSWGDRRFLDDIKEFEKGIEDE